MSSGAKESIFIAIVCICQSPLQLTTSIRTRLPYRARKQLCDFSVTWNADFAMAIFCGIAGKIHVQPLVLARPRFAHLHSGLRAARESWPASYPSVYQVDGAAAFLLACVQNGLVRVNPVHVLVAELPALNEAILHRVLLLSPLFHRALTV